MNNPLYRERVEEQTWWTLKEVSDLTYKTQYGTHYTPYIDNIQLEMIFQQWEDTFAIKEDDRIVIQSGQNYTFRSSDEATLFKLIWSRYWKHYCVEGLTGAEWNSMPQEDIDIIWEFYYRIHNIWLMTKQKYGEILNAYLLLAGELTAQVKTNASGTTRFNDTPQDEGTFDDDGHTSHITQTSGESSTDMNTPIERLKEIHDKYDNIMLEWCNEFDKLFLEGDNL